MPKGCLRIQRLFALYDRITRPKKLQFAQGLSLPPTREAMDTFTPGKPSWWQWPTILSLDAPIVAVAWQWLIARSTGDTLGWHHHFILFTAVWLAYSADRWIEGWFLDPGKMQTHRHLFYQRHRWSSFSIWLIVIFAGISTAFGRLEVHEFEAGLILLAPVIVYLLSHQLVHRHHPMRVPKEICVGLLFAAGVSCFTLVRIPISWNELGVPLTLFGLLCFTNCALISVWEDEVDRRHRQTSLALQYPGGLRLVRLLPWLIAVFGLSFALSQSGTLRTATFCAAASGGLLGLVDRAHARSGRQLARVLADFVLLTPLVPWAAQTSWR